MAAAKFKLHLEAGASYDKVIRWKAGGVPVDLTGATARMDVRASIDDAAVLLSLTTENGCLVLGGTDGTITFAVPASTTGAQTWDQGVQDMLIYFPGGKVRRLVKGPALVDKGVTRA